MHPRRPLLKRVCLWTAAVVLLLAGYLAGMPFVITATILHAPALLPAAWAFYSPVTYAIANDLPGTNAYESYYRWCMESLGVDMG
jgi:hypothetical protein